MGISIEKIVFNNYRQYGSTTLRFNHSDTSKLSVIIAQNGTGKTTLLNAITWCLYGKELHLADEHTALPIINTAIVSSSEDGRFVPASVAITILDDGHVLEFKREANYKILKTADDTPTVIAGTQSFTVSITSINNFQNTQIKTGVDADVIVKQYFDEAIFQFYFFDGEKLRDFFSAGQSASIKSSIFNISQITLLESACTHLRKIQSDKARKLGKGSPDIEALQDKKDAQVKLRDTSSQTLDANNALLIDLRKEQTQLNDALRGYAPIQKLQKERTTLESNLNALVIEEKLWHSRRSEFVRKYTTLLGLYPSITHTLEIIARKEADGDMPPAIDKDQVKTLLSHLDEPCPLCNNKIGETGREHLETLLSKITLSSHTSNYLKEIKGSLELFRDETLQYKKKKEQLIQEETDILSRKKEITDRLSEINSILSNYESGDDVIDVSAIENKRSIVNNNIENANKLIGAAETTIKACNDNIATIDKEIIEASKKIQECDDIRAQLEVLIALQNNFENIKNNIMSVMRAEIEKTTWEFFDAMIWKKNTFGNISIGENYDVSVYDKQGVKMTGSLSATEQMALAYAFTLAIHKASGKNCPLVIDSPLGRVSDTNRENMARSLGEISKSKQLIMLFTPDEYSEVVKAQYENFAEVRYLTLSTDENYIERIDD